MKTVLSGGIYFLADSVVVFPENLDREPRRERRPVVVVSGSETNSDGTWPFALICPMSSSTTSKTQFCVKLSAEEAAGKKSWVRIPAIQPVLKSALDDHVAPLGEDKLREVQARIAEYLGFASRSRGIL